MVAGGEEEWEGMVKGFGMGVYTLLYLTWMTNKGLLYSIWNSVPCYVAPWIGRGVWGRMDSCVCTAESLHHLKPSQHCLLTGYTPIKNKKFKKKKKPVTKRQILHVYELPGVDKIRDQG